MPITAMLELELKPESVPATRRHAPSASRHEAFDGNLGTDVLVDQDDEAHWINYQRWETVEHEEAYRRRPRHARIGKGRCDGSSKTICRNRGYSTSGSCVWSRCWNHSFSGSPPDE
jgi:hypothetical protein